MVLSVRNLTVRKGRKTLIDGVSLDVGAGEILGLYGPSGAGKSVTLLTIFGLQDRTFSVAGKVRYKGKDISDLPPERRSRLGMSIVLQGLWLFPNRTVVENVAYPLLRRGIPRETATRQALHKLTELHVEDLADRYPHQISGGQQQRAALARANVYGPDLLLLDEPFKGLESELRDHMLTLVRQQAKAGQAIIVVTHDRREINLAADALVAIRHGQMAKCERRVGSSSTPFSITQNRLLVPDSSRPSAELVVATSVQLSDGAESILPGEQVARATVVEVRSLPPDCAAILVRYASGFTGWVEASRQSTDGLSAGAQVFVKYTLAKE